MPKTKKRSYSPDELETIRPEDFRFVHTNRARVSENLFDVTLLFGAILPPAALTGEPPYIEERVGVTMSWEHLKALRDIITERVEHYESQIGAIRNPGVTIAPDPKPRKRKAS